MISRSRSPRLHGAFVSERVAGGAPAVRAEVCACGLLCPLTAVPDGDAGKDGHRWAA